LVQANRVSVRKELVELRENKNKLISSLARNIEQGAPSKTNLAKNMHRKKPNEFYKEMRYKR